MRLIKVATPAERREAAALAAEYGAWAKRRAYEELGIDVDAAPARGLATSIEEMLEPRGRLYLATLEDIPVGVGGLKPLGPEVAELKRFYVRPHARGRGIGRALLARLIDDARSLAFSTVYLESGRFMREAHGLYRAFGFTETTPYEHRELAAVPGMERGVVFMELRLRDGAPSRAWPVRRAP